MLYLHILLQQTFDIPLDIHIKNFLASLCMCVNMCHSFYIHSYLDIIWIWISNVLDLLNDIPSNISDTELV